jgi:hypothetical protein
MISENPIDDAKFAIASMFGALPQPAAAKVHRGLSAVVLAGRFAGGRAYGCREVTGFDDCGRPMTLLEITATCGLR